MHASAMHIGTQGATHIWDEDRLDELSSPRSLLGDSKNKVSIEYVQQPEGSAKPKKIHTVSQQREAQCEQAMELERGHREAAQLQELRCTSKSSRADAP